jgi:hypothetical protein
MENKERVRWQFCYVGNIPRCRFCDYDYSITVPPLFSRGATGRLEKSVKEHMKNIHTEYKVKN